MIGIYLMLGSMLCAAVMNTAVRALVGSMPTTQMVLLRNIASLVLIFLWIAVRRENVTVLRTTKPLAHLWRASIGFCAMELWFYAVSLMPLNMVTALSFTTPVFSTICAIVILKEKAGWRRWLAVLIGFLGVIVILRPTSTAINPAAGIVLLSSALMALAGVTVKSLTRTEPPETIVFYMAAIMTPLSAPLAVAHWVAVTSKAAGLILVVALFSTAMHLMLARAYRHADMVALLPFDFTRLVFTAILAYLFFGETLDKYTVLGSAIIMASSLYIVHRERLRRGATPLETGEI